MHAVTNDSVGIWAPMNTTYRCLSPAPIRMEDDLVTLSGVRLEAYMLGDDLSPAGRTRFFLFQQFFPLI